MTKTFCDLCKNEAPFAGSYKEQTTFQGNCGLVVVSHSIPSKDLCRKCWHEVRVLAAEHHLAQIRELPQ